jgi:hypothetical protein
VFLRAVLTLLVALVVGCSSTAVPSPTPSPSPSTPAPTATPTSSPSGSPTPTPTLAELVADSDGTFDFLHPDTWQRTVPNRGDPTQDRALTYLANFPLVAECVVVPPATPQPSPSGGEPCLVPFGLLPNGGVFVEIYAARLVGSVPKAGEAIQVAGFPSSLEVAKPGRCANQIVDEVLIAPIPEPPTGENYYLSVVACLRGPKLDDNVRAVRAFIESIKRR